MDSQMNTVLRKEQELIKTELDKISLQAKEAINKEPRQGEKWLFQENVCILL